MEKRGLERERIFKRTISSLFEKLGDVQCKYFFFACRSILGALKKLETFKTA